MFSLLSTFLLFLLLPSSSPCANQSDYSTPLGTSACPVVRSCGQAAAQLNHFSCSQKVNLFTVGEEEEEVQSGGGGSEVTHSVTPI